MTNQKWLSTLSPYEWMKTVDWLFHVYGRRHDNAHLAVLEWLSQKHTENSVKY